MKIATVKKILGIFRYLTVFAAVGVSVEIIYATYCFLIKAPDAPWWAFTIFYAWLFLGLGLMIWCRLNINYLEEKAIEYQNRIKQKEVAN